jgi:hypothetical protein
MNLCPEISQSEAPLNLFALEWVYTGSISVQMPVCQGDFTSILVLSSDDMGLAQVGAYSVVRYL